MGNQLNIFYLKGHVEHCIAMIGFSEKDRESYLYVNHYQQISNCSKQHYEIWKKHNGVNVVKNYKHLYPENVWRKLSYKIIYSDLNNRKSIIDQDLVCISQSNKSMETEHGMFLIYNPKPVSYKIDWKRINNSMGKYLISKDDQKLLPWKGKGPFKEIREKVCKKFSDL